MIQDRYDVAVVGAGPAGMAAASLCARAGLSTVVFDRRASAGGNPGSCGERIVASFLASGARFVPAAEVGSLTAEGEVTVHAGGQTHALHATYIVLATGGIERPFEMPGASLPGAAMAGAAGVPEGRTVLAGSGVYFWQIATRLLDAGARIETILDTTPAANRLRARRHWLARLFAAPVRDHHALASAVRRRVRVIENVGDPRAVGGVAFDNLLLHAGVVPDTALAAAAGLARRADGVPEVSEFGASSTPGIYVVGEGAGVRGAQAAPWHGTLAAADIVFTVRPEIAKPAAALARTALARFARGNAYFDALYGDPPIVLHGSSAKTAIKVGDT